MLDKFWCVNLVNFCRLYHSQRHDSESLRLCIADGRHQEVGRADESVKAKLVLDAAKGIAYLHENGVPHRDIELDHVIIFTPDEELSINRRLTDFGSIRNVALLSTFMTFTNGIEFLMNFTVPDIQNKNKCKKAASLKSLRKILYKCFQ